MRRLAVIVTDTEYISKRELGRLLGISLSTIDRMIAANVIPFVRVKSFTGGRHRVHFKRQVIHAWIEKRILVPSNN